MVWNRIFSLPLHVDSMFICNSNFLILQVVSYFEVDQPSKVTYACGHVIVFVASQVQCCSYFPFFFYSLIVSTKGLSVGFGMGENYLQCLILSRISWFLGSFEVNNIAVIGEVDIRSSFMSFYTNTQCMYLQKKSIWYHTGCRYHWGKLYPYTGIAGWGTKALTQESIPNCLVWKYLLGHWLGWWVALPSCCPCTQHNYVYYLNVSCLWKSIYVI